MIFRLKGGSYENHDEFRLSTHPTIDVMIFRLNAGAASNSSLARRIRDPGAITSPAA
jgi:hypothetical protein